MNSPMSMAGILTLLAMVLAKVAVLWGCGVIPQGQAITRNFTVSGFRLPTAMAYSASPGAAAQLPDGVATTSDGAKSFVSRLVMQTIIDVLEQQGRRAGLSDAIVLMILNQLMVQISYDPLECKTVAVGIPANGQIMGVNVDMQPHCITVGSTVTALCTKMQREMCEVNTNMGIGAIDTKHLSISGSLTTTNIIMANWSREMWQNVVNRAVRMLASSPFASHFFSAFATVN
ncbi:hypothetical protein KIN20_016550 [Parelaphostrongylus tenuis]|uniref:Uncharacterized protein n=1 Tax=Parelaphostrongylus tenuis TaxID=148309 RepID=A0AAD5MLT1_PARTN|nr:hypothetical protein KIN20_016550 [Parelaphostrongylus tenuis]